MAKIGEPWLGPARLLERQGLIVLWRCLAGHYAARLTPAGAEVLSTWRSCAEGAASWGHIRADQLGGWEWGEPTLLVPRTCLRAMKVRRIAINRAKLPGGSPGSQIPGPDAAGTHQFGCDSSELWGMAYSSQLA